MNPRRYLARMTLARELVIIAALVLLPALAVNAEPPKSDDAQLPPDLDRRIDEVQAEYLRCLGTFVFLTVDKRGAQAQGDELPPPEVRKEVLWTLAEQCRKDRSDALILVAGEAKRRSGQSANLDLIRKAAEGYALALDLVLWKQHAARNDKPAPPRKK